MRTVFNPQMMFGLTDISAIDLSRKSRDDVPYLLRGLQHIYCKPELRQRVFAILAEVLPQGSNGPADPNNGRPGMSQWTILVLGIIRLGLNADFDRLHELANEHKTLRMMIGLGGWEDPTQFELQTLKDNVQLFTPEILERINQVVVDAGHQTLKKSPEEGLNARCDSFVVETNVHYPTDTNLLFDAIRKTIQICAGLSLAFGLTEWRQSEYQIRQFKYSYRKIQKLKHSTSKDEQKRLLKQGEIEEAHEDYLVLAQGYLERARVTRLTVLMKAESGLLGPLDTFIGHAERQIDQVRRRVLQGETIAHAEKVFSLFQPHTEWISKGKAGVPVELGLRVCVVEDQYQFIIGHQVMEKQTDEAIAVPITQATLERFPTLTGMSFDKGFHSPSNQVELAALIDRIVLPKKGRLSAVESQRQSEPEFKRTRRQHSAVESAINALESHGLDRCPDHGIDGFKRYVAFAVLSRNVQRLGVVLWQQNEKQRRGPYQKAA